MENVGTVTEKVFPGIHPSAQLSIDKSFSDEEKRIIRRWSEEWYVTSAGVKTTPTTCHKFALVKPTSLLEEALSISREIVVIIAPYTSFEARTLDAYGTVVADLNEQRYEKLCYALVSADENIENSLKHYLNNQENQMVVPFSYSMFSSHKWNNGLIKNQFRKVFYSHDLFDYSEPLKKETFFFGRTDIVTQIITKHRNGSNYGLFGLRKTGKTSIIYDVDRKSNAQEFVSIIIDCQDTSFNMRTWNKALYFIIDKIGKKMSICDIPEEESFTVEDASSIFNAYIQKYNRIVQKTILLMFDEIENITFGKSSVSHWCEGLDFVYFWQSIRSAYQSTNNVFTFCIFGTNAKCIEDSVILGKDNPIYNMFQPFYIPGFNYEQTREMVRKLGRIMGIKFDDGIYTRLFEDYGGHPFLIRRVCSKISQHNTTRPVRIDRGKYTLAKNEFNLENNYFDMILQVLKQFYSDEYEMLKFLACGDSEAFDYFVREDRTLINHLVGYGLISENEGRFDFKIDAIKDYMLRINAAHPEIRTEKEKWAYLSSQRNSIETNLRKMVKSIIRFAYKNEHEAKKYVVKKIYANDKKYASMSYSDLFDSRICDIYLKKLVDLINANWEYFADYFGKQEIFIANANLLNNEGRFDAHATVPDEDEINAVSNAIKHINRGIEKYKDSLE